MKWKTWQRQCKPTPALGSKRTIQRFAFLPIQCEDGYSRWLTLVPIKQIYVETKRNYHGWSYPVSEWQDEDVYNMNERMRKIRSLPPPVK